MLIVGLSSAYSGCMPEDRFYNSVLETGENGKQRLENRLNAWPGRSRNLWPQELSRSLEKTKYNFDLISSVDNDIGYRGIMERMAKNRSAAYSCVSLWFRCLLVLPYQSLVSAHNADRGSNRSVLVR